MKARSFTGARMPLRAEQSFRAINSALRSALGRIEESDHPGRRRRGIVQGFVTGLGSRGVGFLVSFLSVPLTIGYLGRERYGVWILLSSLLAWVRLTDLGISNGLRSAIASALGSGRPDLARAHISTAFALLSTIAAVVGLITAVAWPWIDWVALFGITTEDARAEVGPAIATSFGFFLLVFPLSITGVTYDALQEGKLQNYWGMVGNIASLVALIVVTRTHGGLVRLVLAVSGTGLIVNVLSGVWLFGRYKPLFAPRPQAVQISSARRLLHAGGTFFLIQIVALTVFQTANFIVAKFAGSASVPSYSLTYTLFSYSYLPQTILFNYLWVAYADAIARRDIGVGRPHVKAEFVILARVHSSRRRSADLHRPSVHPVVDERRCCAARRPCLLDGGLEYDLRLLHPDRLPSRRRRPHEGATGVQCGMPRPWASPCRLCSFSRGELLGSSPAPSFRT